MFNRITAKSISMLLALCFAADALASCTPGSGGTDGTDPGSTTENSNAVATDVKTPSQDDPDITDNTKPPREKSDLPRIAATEGMVLLKNEDGVLPLKSGSAVAVFGKGQIDLSKGGGGSGDVRTEHVVGLLEGLENKEKENKIAVVSSLAKKYKANSSYTPALSAIQTAAKETDTAIIVITRTSGEGYDRSATAGDYYLADSEKTLISNIIKGGFKNIIAVLNVGGIIDTTELLSYPEIKSILLAWQPGQEGGDAIADLLVGDVTPSGRLADTFAKSYDDYPTSESFNESPAYVKYTEDIFVGYRYFETFDPTYSKVNFEFGFGLSYTTFEYSDIVFTENDDDIKVKLNVKNTGERSGKEVVEMYFSAPQGLLGKPGKELCAFAKTKTLSPGESETVTLTVAKSDLSSYDDTGKVQKSAYITEAGNYNFYIGQSIKLAGEAGVRYTYKVEDTIINEQLTEQMTAKLLEKRLLADGTYENIWNDSGIGIPLSEGATRIEAEAFYTKHEHADVVFNGNATKCGLKMLTSDAGNRYATFAVEAPAQGAYNVTLGIGNENGKINNAVRFYVNDVAQSGSLPLSDSGGFWTTVEIGSATVILKEGLNFIKIEFACGDKFQGFLDYIIVAPGEGSYEEPVVGETIKVKSSGVTKVEGEAFFDKTDDVGTEEISAGSDKGGISIKNLHTAGYFISYRLNAEEAGDYRIVMRLANGLGAATNAASAAVNSLPQSGFKYGIAYTGSSDNQWFNFVDVDAGIITLGAGTNILTFTVIERMGNLDYFTLEKVGATAAPAVSAVSAAKSDSIITFNDLVEDPALMEAFIDQLTIEQMVYLLHGHGENVPHGTGTIGGLVEYGIPSAETSDGPAGINLYVNTTAWPVETLMACTWNVGLMKEVGAEIADEAAYYDIDIWLAPAVNIHRNPLCGRNFEYYSEDPFLSGIMASALISGVQDNGIGTMIKHFVCNEKETNRSHSDSRVSERALREIYLRPFEIAVKSVDPWAIMTSYNKVNGVEVAERGDILTNVLRGEWGYDGLVSTDWWNDSIQYKEVLAGQNLKMKSGQEDLLIGAYKTGMLTREDIEQQVQRVLELVMKTNAVKRISEESYIEIKPDSKTTIRSIDSTWKSSEIGMEECKDKNGTYNTTNTYEGQWIVFLIDVKQSGKYKINVRVASNDGSGAIAFSVDGGRATNFKNTKKTGDWQKWADSDGSVTLNLTEGTHQLKLAFAQGGFNINTITFTPQ